MHIFTSILAALSLLTISSLLAADEMNIQPWSDSLFIQIEKEYGKQGADRMRKLHKLIVENRDKPIEVKLKVTNDALNRLPWVTDQEKYNKNDYWATPMETIATFGGDCEDMAIGKFMVLRLMGVPKENLRLGYVKIKKTGEAHMVLAYINDINLPPAKRSALILDNYVKEILPGKERKDLLAVYLVDAEKKMTLFNDDGKTRSVKSQIDSAKMAKLDKIKKKISENRTKYQKYNDGRPIY